MAQRIALPKTQQADPFYRYTRDLITIQSHQRGQLAEWTNVDTVLAQLMTTRLSENGKKKQKDHLVRYLRAALSTAVLINPSGTVTIRGKTQAEIEAAFEQFIVRYYLCPTCRLPELTEAGGCRACPAQLV